MKGKINMKKLTKILSLLMALTLLLSFPVAVSAAELEDAPIDESRTGSLTIYKNDMTNAEKDGVWDSSYVSTGVFDQTGVNDVLGGGESALGNGEAGYGYAIKGVEFSFIQVADIVQFSESENDSRTDSHVEILYAIDKTKGADFLKALGLENGLNRYTNADQLDSTKYYYQSDVLIDALAAALESNSTVVKNALEAYISANGGAAMPLTDSYGKTKAENLNLGLYLVVETKVPEMVVSTTDPFLVSVPMTSVNGTNATDGGTRWIYDITLYPKNLTGIPSLEKTLRENQSDTGKTDAYAHTGTASAGDTIDYQIISTLPSITSESTYLSCYTFVDTLSKGLSYNKGDVVLEFFTDAACMDSVAKWTEADGKFTVAYNTTDTGDPVMTIEMTAAGLTEINTSKAVYSGASMVNSGYSDCTVRITYAAKMDSSSDLVFGDKGNDNKVVLTWKHSSQNYYDSQLDITGSGIMGYVRIPKISVTLPIYHGTGSNTLSAGIGHLLGSSLPIGGESTHTVLTAHSGMASQKMFSDLDQLGEGDVFYLEVLDEVLAYQVDAINTVLPHDTTYLGITTGEDYCTLVTCTPFGVNTHRLLVRGSRILYEEAEETVSSVSSEEAAASTWEEKYINGILTGLCIVGIIGIIAVTVWYIRRR